MRIPQACFLVNFALVVFLTLDAFEAKPTTMKELLKKIRSLAESRNKALEFSVMQRNSVFVWKKIMEARIIGATDPNEGATEGTVNFDLFVMGDTAMADKDRLGGCQVDIVADGKGLAKLSVKSAECFDKNVDGITVGGSATTKAVCEREMLDIVKKVANGKIA